MRLSLALVLALLAGPAAAADTRAIPGVVQPVGLPTTAAPALPAAPYFGAGVAVPALAAPATPPAAAPVAVAAPKAEAHATAAGALAAVAGQAASPAARAGSGSPSNQVPPAEAGGAGGVFDGSRPLRIVQAAGESVPFIKTGGLADVVDAVSRGLAARGHDVTLVLAKYGQLKTGGAAFERVGEPVAVRLDNRTERAQLWVGRYEGVRVVLIENDHFFGRDGPYGSAYGDFGDNDERFSFYAHAVLAAAAALHLAPDVLHVHDWQAALIPPILKLQDGHPALAAAKTVLTLHNLAFQGLFPPVSALKAGFSSRDMVYNKLEYHGKFGFLKSGIQYADALTTVSPNYAREIRASNEFGMGLEELLRFRGEDLHGVLNGVDPKLWDPAADQALARRYGVDDAAAGKAANKLAVQRTGGLAVDPSRPLLGVVSRLSHQKGIDVILDAAPRLLAMGFQLAVTGTGDPELIARLERLSAEHPGRVWLNAAFSEDAARMIYAASDFLLMPSRFEPCGLSQLMAQRYGSLPIVTPTGGLVDTVKDLRADARGALTGSPSLRSGDGLVMSELSPAALAEAAAAALALHEDPAALARSRRAAMLKDSSWDRAILEYEALYRRLVGA